jgi:hypothetical protein
MGDLTPEAYEALTGVTKVEYEARALAAARASAVEFYPPGSTEATIEAIEIEGSGNATNIVVLFRIPAQPDPLWGCRVALWPAESESWPGEILTPEDVGVWCIEMGVSEYVDQGGLVVRDFVRDSVTWLP